MDELRPLAFAVAYRMLGSVADAEDVVQEALMRLHVASEGVGNREAFLTTVTTRLAIDALRAAGRRRETYVGSWLPEPLVEDAGLRRVEDEETISLAFLVLLERLGPEERAVLVLREAFDYGFGEIAEVLGKSEDNCRQILSRARRRVEDGRPRFEVDVARRHALVQRFLDAAREGSLDALVATLAPDVVLVGDGGGKARAIPRPMVGAAKVGRALATFHGMSEEWGVRLDPALVNGQPGFVSRDGDGRVVNVLAVDVEASGIRRVYSVLNPDKLGHLGEVSDLGLRPGATA